MAEVAEQGADLPAMMGVMLNEIDHHVHGPARLALDASPGLRDRLLEEFPERPATGPQRPLSIGFCNSEPVQGGERSCPTHLRKGFPHAMDVRDDRGDSPAATGGWGGAPEPGRHLFDQKLSHRTAMVELVEEFTACIEGTPGRHARRIEGNEKDGNGNGIGWTPRRTGSLGVLRGRPKWGADRRSAPTGVGGVPELYNPTSTSASNRA